MGKQDQTMSPRMHALSACLLFLVMIQAYSQVVPFKPIDDAQRKRAVCVDGSSGGYFYSPGFGNGVNNWLIFLMGGGWCWEGVCAKGMQQGNENTRKVTFANFTGILSENQTLNPDFHHWNRVWFYYCDGASFLGDTEVVDNRTLVQLRGSRIFYAIMDELLYRGMHNADNAILMGSSAGGLATILHCDDFRALLPNANRVKCISDAGFFLHGKDLPFAWNREWIYNSTVKIHNITSYLPSYCTSKRDAGLCLFPEYLVSYVKTPLFLLNSAFDFFQIHDNLNLFPPPPDWERCTNNLSACTPLQAEVIKDFGRAFLEAIESLGDNPSRGLLINSCYVHGMTRFNGTMLNKAYGLENMTIRQALADWYFDRSPVRLITQDTFPKNCV